jgi:hypothetical protein
MNGRRTWRSVWAGLLERLRGSCRVCGTRRAPPPAEWPHSAARHPATGVQAGGRAEGPYCGIHAGLDAADDNDEDEPRPQGRAHRWAH